MLTSIIVLILSQRGVVMLFEEKEVIPLIAYFDKRPSNGHENATVILARVEKRLLAGNKIIGCGIAGKPASSFEVVLLDAYNTYIHKLSPSLTHDSIVMFCYDLQLPSIQAKPFITYKNAYDYLINVLTKVNITTNNRMKMPYFTSPTVLLCALQITGTEWLTDEWIKYHRSIGVDFFHLYTVHPLTNKSLENNYRDFLRIHSWRSTIDGEILQSQSVQTMDCLYRYQGSFQYVLVLDTTDYFIPMIPNKFNIKDYIKVIFEDMHTGSVLFRRVVYNVKDSYEFKTQLHNMNVHPNISSILTSQEFKELSAVTKGLHKISAVREITSQKAASLMPGYTTETVSPDMAYVVHIRNRKSS